MVKKELQKEFGKVKFVENINLFKNNINQDIKQFNLQYFDKTMLEYKKHFLFLTDKAIIIVGYNSFKDKVDKMYKKVFELNKVKELALSYKTAKWTEKHYETQTNYKKVRSVDTGRSYVEEIEERVPYDVEREQDIFINIEIDFQNTLVQALLLGFPSRRKSIIASNKLIKVCSKLNINCQTYQVG